VAIARHARSDFSHRQGNPKIFLSTVIPGTAVPCGANAPAGVVPNNEMAAERAFAGRAAVFVYQCRMNSGRLAGRVAIVTGGARGIGFTCAERLLDDGAAVSLWDRDEARLAEARETLASRGRIQTVTVDLTEPESVVRGALETETHFGGIDILLNNAAIAGPSIRLWECSVEDWEAVIRVNLLGVFFCCRAVVPALLRRGRGRIISIASIAGKEGNPLASHYSASKAGVIALTKSLGKELATSGILVHAIAPAVIETEMLRQCSREHLDYMLSKIPMGRPGQPAEVAALVAWLASDECSFSTGAVWDLSGGRAVY
jgi:NAD(P)-dependent dehydrogenase (short-subunit alcohol dehydrogenase family)